MTISPALRDAAIHLADALNMRSEANKDHVRTIVREVLAEELGKISGQSHNP
jgi:hypothetical protein